MHTGPSPGYDAIGFRALACRREQNYICLRMKGLRAFDFVFEGEGAANRDLPAVYEHGDLGER
jgi:hypothetical protein